MRDRDRVWYRNSAPRYGMLPSTGTWLTPFSTWSWIRPPSTTSSSSFGWMTVWMARLLVVGPAGDEIVEFTTFETSW